MTFLTDVVRDYPDYLRDESRKTGSADTISFPKTEAELVEQMTALYARKTTVTVQGARTGIAGGAVPNGGHILNLSRMNRILRVRKHSSEDCYLIAVQPGILLSELRTAAAKRDFGELEVDAGDLWAVESPYFFPPDPTEASASIGGMVACNASGARTFFYGPTRRYVEAIRVVLADGSVLALRRGAQRVVGRQFSVKAENGRIIEGIVPSYRMPDVKNAAGYFAMADMDLIDAFIGSEGTLGVISEMELRLIPAPRCLWGVMTFFGAENHALAFVRRVREAGQKPSALEFLDCGALDLLRQQKKVNPAFSEVQEIPQEHNTAVYVEYHGDSESDVESAVMAMSEIMVECGGNEDATWLSTDEHDLERLKAFRHAVPEAVNLQIDERRKKEPRLTKLGTDLAVPDASLEKVIALYHDGLARTGLEFIMFGHVGNNHLHVNIIPNTMEEYDRGKALYIEWARAVVAMGGTVSAEHGVGKLKVALLREMYGESGIREMIELKKLFDGDGLLDRGNLFALTALPGTSAT